VSPARFTAPRTLHRIWSVLRKAYEDFDRNNYLSFAAALSFYFLLSLFPLLIFLSSLFAFIQTPYLFQQTLEIMGRLVPNEAMAVVRGVAKEVVRTNPRLLSFSIGWALFAASGGFNALITTLNIAYEVRETRPYWKKRLIACGLTLLSGGMLLIALIATVLGPEFGRWLAAHVELGTLPAGWWQYIRWTLVTVFTILSVETIYFVAPNVKQRFRDQIPGAVVAVLSWIVASWGLGWYVRQVAHYNLTFGALGAVVGLMMWFYVTALALILGAEINAELLRSRGRVPLQRKPAHAPLHVRAPDAEGTRRSA
jgi:membrane protein